MPFPQHTDAVSAGHWLDSNEGTDPLWSLLAVQSRLWREATTQTRNRHGHNDDSMRFYNHFMRTQVNSALYRLGLVTQRSSQSSVNSGTVAPLKKKKVHPPLKPPTASDSSLDFPSDVPRKASEFTRINSGCPEYLSPIASKWSKSNKLPYQSRFYKK